ncbi:sulfite exporter TauE/SafE family protein [Helicobacter vulpis]|uniref:sulfite exporter TauE/SafE family protein n=1 Tax=Helicobacter vulpis TaxID=2316076 RepID=UPI0022873430|nr:TSUP family transporter [Helicobacter vulpis]
MVCFLPIGLLIAFVKGRFNPRDQSQENISISIPRTLSCCFVVGFYDGFFGPGTGSLFIIILVLFNRLNLLQSSATSKIFNFSSNIGAFIVFLIGGHMNFLIGVPMIIASLLGNHFGSVHAIKTSGLIVRKVLFITVLLMIITLIVQFIKNNAV